MILMKYNNFEPLWRILFYRKLTSVSEILLYDMIRFYDLSNKDLLADLFKGKICLYLCSVWFGSSSKKKGNEL